MSKDSDSKSIREFIDTARFEGDRGVENLAMVIERLVGSPGIKQLQFNNGCYVTSITEFLADNPGCITAMLEWMEENYESEIEEGEDSEDHGWGSNEGEEGEDEEDPNDMDVARDRVDED